MDDSLGAKGTKGFGINNVGEMVGIYFDSNSNGHGFLYSNGTYTTLDDPWGAKGTSAQGVNDMGQIVGSYSDIGLHRHGFFLTITPNPPPPAGTTADMILRHGADGQYEIYDIGNNSLLAAYQLGQVGTDWRFVGLGGFFRSDTSDMILRNPSTRGFEIYDISNHPLPNPPLLTPTAHKRT